MTLRFRFLFVTAGLVAISAALNKPAHAKPLESKVQTLLDRFRAEYGFPGATATYALPDGSIISLATVLADVEAGTAMTPDTRMLAASIGKSFVAATVLALEGDGVLGRDDLVRTI